MRHRSILIVCLLLATTGRADSVRPVAESRQHFKTTSPTGSDDFRVTRISRSSKQRTSTFLLVEDKRGEQYLVTSDRDYVNETQSYEIRDVGGKDFIRHTKFLPARPETGSAAAGTRHNDVVQNHRFEVTGPGDGSVSGTADQWRDARTAKEWRSRIRQMLSPAFLETLEIMETSGLFQQSFANEFDDSLMNDVLYRTQCAPHVDLVTIRDTPDCSFDKRFGFACSDKEKERAAGDAASKPPGTGQY